MGFKMKYIKLFKDSLEVFNTLSDEQTGLLFKAIIDYSNDKEPKLDGLLMAVFFQFKQQIDRAKSDYTEVCNRNKANGNKPKRNKATGSESLKSEAKTRQDKDKDKDKEEEEEKHNVDCDVLEVYEAYKNNIKAAKSKQSSLNNIKAWLKEYDKKILIQAINNYKFVAEKQEEKIYIKDCSNFFGVKNESKGYFVDFIERNINAEETNITILKPYATYKQKPNGQAPKGFKIKAILDGMFNIEGYKIIEDKKDFLI